MCMAELKLTLKRYFELNYMYVSVITLLIWCVVYILVQRRKRKQERSISKKEIVCGFIFSVYIALLIVGTMLNREIGKAYEMELRLFWSYRQYLEDRNPALIVQMIYNVLVFIPWPILLAQIFPNMQKFWRCVGSAFVLSVFIEIIQLSLKLGLFEFDDMFHNTLGAVVGYGIKYFICIIGRKDRGINEYLSNRSQGLHR